MNRLGCCFDHGEGLVEDEGEAFKWYLQSAEEGIKFIHEIDIRTLSALSPVLSAELVDRIIAYLEKTRKILVCRKEHDLVAPLVYLRSLIRVLVQASLTERIESVLETPWAKIILG